MAPVILAIWRVRKAGFDSLAERNRRTSTASAFKRRYSTNESGDCAGIRNGAIHISRLTEP